VNGRLHIARDADDRLVGWIEVEGRRLVFSGVLGLIAVIERLVDSGAPDAASPGETDGSDRPSLTE
jgi:hypothetical protein